MKRADLVKKLKKIVGTQWVRTDDLTRYYYGADIATYLGQGAMLILLYLLIGQLGILAIVVALAASAIIQRVVVHFGAYRVQRFAFQDNCVIVGVVIVCAAAFTSMYFSRSFADRTAILLVFLTVSSVLLLPVFRRLVRFVRHAR